MKRLLVSTLLLLTVVCVSRAQTAAPDPLVDAQNAVPDLLAAPEPGPGEPAVPSVPAPAPKFIYSGRQDYRWQLDLSVVLFRFQSSVFNANAFGEKTSVTYFLNEWLGVEGSVTAAFGPEIYTQG